MAEMERGKWTDQQKALFDTIHARLDSGDVARFISTQVADFCAENHPMVVSYSGTVEYRSGTGWAALTGYRLISGLDPTPASIQTALGTRHYDLFSVLTENDMGLFGDFCAGVLEKFKFRRSKVYTYGNPAKVLVHFLNPAIAEPFWNPTGIPKHASR